MIYILANKVYNDCFLSTLYALIKQKYAINKTVIEMELITLNCLITVVHLQFTPKA